MKSYYLFILLFYSGYISGQPPGGVREINVWLTCDSKNSTVSFSTPVVTNPDISLLNFNPVFDFKKHNKPVHVPVRVNNPSQATIFVVYQETETGAEQNVWKLTGASSSISLTTKEVYDNSGEFSYGTVQPKAAVINTYLKNWKTEKFENIEALTLGNKNGETPFKGLIAEYILYDKVLKRSEQRKVETYLAIKYGITLHHDYISSTGKTLWLNKTNSTYNHRVTGIGRDEQGSLYQKQSENKEKDFSIAIGAGAIANSNRENKSTINELDFLIFGDNDGELIFDNAPARSEFVPLLKRRWLMNLSGTSANRLSTEIRIDASKILTDNLYANNFVLAIDRSGKGDFSSDNTEFIPVNEISNDGVLSFKNIFWDIDGSGKDIFSFGLRPEIKLKTVGTPVQAAREIILYPNPSSNGNYTLTIDVNKPAPVQVNIFDESGRLIQSLFGNKQSRYQFNSKVPGSSGVYTFHITTPYQKTTRQLVVQ